MWAYLTRKILRNRLANLLIVLGLTIFFGWQARIEFTHELVQMLPETDTNLIKYNNFKNTFGKDGSIIFIGVKTDSLFTLNYFNKWYDLTEDFRNINGVKDVMSLTRLFNLVRNDDLKKFEFRLISQQKPKTQTELDSIRDVILNLPFYNKLLLNSQNATYIAVTIDNNIFDSAKRENVVKEMKERISRFSKENNIQIYFSGLPYIRTALSTQIRKEMFFFTLLSLLIASVALYLFFRSFKAVIFPMLIVLVSVVWGMGFMSLMGYKITILTGILPPLIIIIGVENCIFLLNKYHFEYRCHRNKIKALARIIFRVGNATFLTNLTTAVGFAAFIITRNHMLVEFGIVAAVSIMIVFLLCLFLIPIFFSYFDPPEPRHLKHMDNKRVVKLITRILNVVLYRRRYVFITSLVLLGIGIGGVTLLKTSGKVVDDLHPDHPLYSDLMFFEREFNGIMPFEISIDTKKKKGVMQSATLRRIDELEETLAGYPEFSKPLSIAGVVKYARQSFYNGDSTYYSLPNNRDKAFILSYVPEPDNSKKTILNSFIDSNMQVTRVSVQVANIGIKDLERIKNDLTPKINTIFEPEDYSVTLTGISLIYYEGTKYLMNNLLYSLVLAIVVITLLMALLFSSFKMIIISLIPNLLPQLLTAALMGYFAIPVKPSTILIFSVALGISVDNTIHFLSRYRIQLKASNWNIRQSVVAALQETGYSMIYSSVVLFLGFIIFTMSSFGGTEALGYLISFTLLAAVFSNLFILPSLLLWLDNHITTPKFEAPIIGQFDDNDSPELDDLVKNLEHHK